MGGIRIVRDSSRHNIEKKLKELEDQKNKGYITLEEYDTLRIRYERKLGNKEAVSKLQEAKGFKSSSIKEKKAKKDELYDEFVDQYSKSEGKDYGEIQRSNMFSKSTKRAFIIMFILLAFGIGIIAGISAINNVQSEQTPDITITDTAFSADSSSINASNLTQDTSNITYNTTKKTTTKKYTKKTTTNKSSATYSNTSKSSSNSKSNQKVSSSGSSSSSSGSESGSERGSSSGSSSGASQNSGSR